MVLAGKTRAMIKKLYLPTLVFISYIASYKSTNCIVCLIFEIMFLGKMKLLYWEDEWTCCVYLYPTI